LDKIPTQSFIYFSFNKAVLKSAVDKCRKLRFVLILKYRKPAEKESGKILPDVRESRRHSRNNPEL